MPPETIESRFYAARFLPDPRSPLAFHLAVPTFCRAIPVTLSSLTSKELFVPLACFLGDEPRLEVSVCVTLMPREVDAGDFVECSTVEGGAKVIQRRDEEGTQGCQAELFVEYEKSDQTWLRRIRVVKDGEYIFRISGDAPKRLFSAAAEDCALSLRSFRRLCEGSRPHAEPLTEHRGNMPCGFSFRCPESWRLSQRTLQPEHAQIHLDNPYEETVAGSMKIDVYPRQANVPFTRYARMFAEDLKCDGFHLNGAPVVPTDPPPGFHAAHVFAPPAMKNGQAMTATTLILEQAETVARVSVIGPSRKSSPWDWAINKRAFEIACRTLNISDTEYLPSGARPRSDLPSASPDETSPALAPSLSAIVAQPVAEKPAISGVLLTIVSGALSGRRVWLRKGQALTVGRSAQADLVINSDQALAPVHFTLSVSRDSCWMRSPSPHFLTSVNGRAACGEQTLVSGDVITAGRTQFRVTIQDEGKNTARTGTNAS